MSIGSNLFVKENVRNKEILCFFSSEFSIFYHFHMKRHTFVKNIERIQTSAFLFDWTVVNKMDHSQENQFTEPFIGEPTPLQTCGFVLSLKNFRNL
jgi:hypothetical protein